MPRTPEDCVDRIVSCDDGAGEAICNLVQRALANDRNNVGLVTREVCEACCRSLRAPDTYGSVVASLLFNAALDVVTSGEHSRRDVDRARLIMQRAMGQLPLVIDKLPDRRFPPDLPATHTSERDLETSRRWAVGMLTAPRGVSTIHRTLKSLEAAGFRSIQIFAEPGSQLPSEGSNATSVVNGQRLGNFANFYAALAALLTNEPSAEAFAIFQDDLEAASGLRQWCDNELWPQGVGIVSLFTPKLHSDRQVGWRLLSPGAQRICGAQAFVFRRDILCRFLSDPFVLQNLHERQHGDDAVVAMWVARCNLRIAYHTPSMIQHIGHVSSIYNDGPDLRNLGHAVRAVDEIKSWSFPDQPGKIGMIGWNTPTGLGYLNRDIARKLGVSRWLIPDHPLMNSLAPLNVEVEQTQLRELPDEGAVKSWLRGLDWMLFAERPCLDHLPRMAAHLGLGVACIPMWEWIQPEFEWLEFVDLMICPTHLAFLQMCDWKERYGFGWETIHLPWPVDVDRFSFQKRETCERFLFVNGWGGGRGQRIDGTPTPYARKGLELIIEAAELAPDLSFVVRSLTELDSRLPSNIEVPSHERDNTHLYSMGDICVQPSHYEGLGLQLLECQAAGLPLVTTDAPPMNEHQPFRTIPVADSEVIQVGGGPISSNLFSASELVNTLRPLVGAPISRASQQARDFVVTHHSWESARQKIRYLLVKRS